MGWLMLAIAAEVGGTAALATGARRRPAAVVVATALWGVSLYLFSLSVRSVPLGAAYATWSGLGTAALAVIGWSFLRQRLDAREIVGMTLIVAGVIVLQIFSSDAGGVLR